MCANEGCELCRRDTAELFADLARAQSANIGGTRQTSRANFSGTGFAPLREAIAAKSRSASDLFVEEEDQPFDLKLSSLSEFVS